MKKYKFIMIKQVNDELFEKKPVYRIINNKNGQQLGIISFYKPWKEYVFSSQPECVFNNSCLRDVLDFIENVITSNDVKEKEPHEYWYYFGKCMPYPHQIKKGSIPVPPYKMFDTKEECQTYIDNSKKKV